MENKLIKIINIVGPTASGKTKLGVEIAKIFGGEVISADSMQVYKEFDILSAKPSPEEMQGVQHHLVDCIPVSQEYSVSEFVSQASEAIKSVSEKGSIPVLVGGTGLYVDSLLRGMSFEKDSSRNDSKRDELFRLENEELMAILRKIDKTSAEKIHPNDKKRLVRAIEFFYCSGYPISEQTKKSKLANSPYLACRIGLNFKDRNILYDRINRRVEKMFESGMVEEVRKVSESEISKTAQAAIGYKELLPYINGKCTLEEAKENLKQASRRYAKRQLTWFRRDEKINWIYVDELEDSEKLTKIAEDIIKKFEW